MKNAIKVISFVFLFALLNASYNPGNLNAEMTTHRISGDTRYNTSANIALEGWPGGSDWAIIAYGGNFPDALSSTPLAVKYNAPILLSEKLSLTAVTKNTLSTLGTKNVVIVGGTTSVSATVEGQIKNMGISVTRIAGSDRYNTSLEIAKALNSESGQIIIAPGTDYPNALSISSYAGKNQIPIILVARDSVSQNLKTYLSKKNILKTYIIGNATDISDTVASAFQNVTRIQGSDKYATNLAVIKTFESDFSLNNVFLATSTSFADALSGSSYAAKVGSPIILTGKSADNRITAYISANNSTIGQLNLLGGELAIPTSLVNNYLGITSAATLSASEIFSTVSPSVVYVETFDASGSAIASGSGFVVDGANGKIVTNFHVISGASIATVKTSTGTTYNIDKVLSYDETSDLAVLKISSTSLKSVTLGDSSLVNTGDNIYTIGNPLGLENTISNGLISTKERVVDGSTYIQISAPISHGSSGGVLLNDKGIVIGITAAGIDTGQNLNFAIPVNILKPMLSQNINKTLSEIQPTSSTPTTGQANLTYADVQNYLIGAYGTNVIDGRVIKYLISVSSYQGDTTGVHDGSIFIVFTPTSSTEANETYVISNYTADYMNWFKTVLNDIDSRYGDYEYNGGFYAGGSYYLMFHNWDGGPYYWVPSN